MLTEVKRAEERDFPFRPATFARSVAAHRGAPLPPAGRLVSPQLSPSDLRTSRASDLAQRSPERMRACCSMCPVGRRTREG